MPVEAAVAAGTMEITVSKFELLRELTATQGVVERKTTIPILSNFLFEAADNRLTITAPPRPPLNSLGPDSLGPADSSAS